MSKELELKLTDGVLEGDKGAAVEAAFKALLEKIKLAQACDYTQLCEDVATAAQELHAQAILAGVTVEVDYNEFGVGGRFDLEGDYGQWVTGAHIAGTWVPSSLGC